MTRRSQEQFEQALVRSACRIRLLIAVAGAIMLGGRRHHGRKRGQLYLATADNLSSSPSSNVLRARKFFQFAIEKSDHYSKSGLSPKGLCLGSANECFTGAGDCCTDQHALFIALCRARAASVASFTAAG